MELIETNQDIKTVGEALPAIMDDIEVISPASPFIEANTVSGSLSEIKQGHIIPVFIKDNEPVISHSEFIETTLSVAMEVFSGEGVLKPNIRLSHPIKGRIPEAKLKPANMLLEHEKTIYYERMAFIIEIPTIYTDIGGNRLTLSVGGVKAYNLDNLCNKSGADQHFKIFIGFKNTVCTNLCVATDGYQANLRVKNLDMLRSSVKVLLQDFDAVELSRQFREFNNHQLTEQQFAQLIGRCRMYRFLPDVDKQNIPELMFGEGQLNAVCNDYYKDKAFSRSEDGSLNLWNLFNLFTGANKSSYIDSFLDRSVNAYQLINTIKAGLRSNGTCWYLY